MCFYHKLDVQHALKEGIESNPMIRVVFEKVSAFTLWMSCLELIKIDLFKIWVHFTPKEKYTILRNTIS